MKTIVVIVLGLLLGLMCDKPYQYNPDPGRLTTAFLNDLTWEGEAFLYFRVGQMDTVDIIVIVYSSEKFQRENLSFYNIPLAVGRYALYPTTIFNANSVTGARYGTYLADGDVLGERYFVADVETYNWVEIGEINLSTGSITGKFEVVMPIDTLRGKQFETSPDTVTFRLGEFKTK